MLILQSAIAGESLLVGTSQLCVTHCLSRQVIHWQSEMLSLCNSKPEEKVQHPGLTILT
jgi:hypothetical protein